MIVNGEKKKFASRMNMIRSSAPCVMEDPPAPDEEQGRDEELAVQLEDRRQDRRGPRQGDVVPEWSARRLLKSPAFVSCRTKPWVTRIPFTDSASVAVTRLKLSDAARVSRLSFIRKWLFTAHRIGAIPTTTRNIFQSV
jgi:hypothetical protein